MGAAMNVIQAFFLGIMVAWTPGLLVLALLLLLTPDEQSAEGRADYVN